MSDMAVRGRTIIVTVTIDDRRITLEGPEPFVRTEVQRLTESITSPTPPVSKHGGEVRGAETGAVTEAALVATKRPGNHCETVAVLAYSLKQEGTEEFSEDDIRRAYLRARLRPPKVVSQAIRDAKNAFDYIEAGSKRGLYKLSHYGETTVVFDLPREGGRKG